MLSTHQDLRRTARRLYIVVGAWGLVVAIGSWLGWFALLPLPLFGVLVGICIVVASTLYFTRPSLRRLARHWGLRPLTAIHAWRIPAALTFFLYGARDELPALFVTLAGWGDLIAGILALVVVALPERRAAYWGFHLFGMADFVVAVGTGLTFSLLQVPTMHTIASFPLALIPLLGVALSGALHLVAFDLLLRPETAKGK